MLALFRFPISCNRLCFFGQLCFPCLLQPPVLDIIVVVEVTEHVQEYTGVQREEEVDKLGIVAIGEHNGEVVVENNAELDLK